MTELKKLITSLREHGEKYPAEKEATLRTIEWIERHGEFAFMKDNLEGHITGSMMITNPNRTKALLMFHKKLQIWAQFGGHCDGEIDVRNVALREFHEESGIIEKPEISKEIFRVEVHDIPLDTKGRPPHQHFDIMYLGIIGEDVKIEKQDTEVDDIQWIPLEDIDLYITSSERKDRFYKIVGF